MRLETELTTGAPPFDTFAEIEKQPDLYDESREQLTAGIRAAQRGDRAQARTALLRCTEIDPRNENAWLWLASISEYPEELLVFLNNVLEINPANARALDWRTATNSLLAKTFVQRGIDAVEENQKEHASDYFAKALEYDQNNSLAWMWMASLSDSPDGQLIYLEKALIIDPQNDAALNAYKAVKREITARHLADAKAAAVSGRINDANELLSAVLEEMPDSEDAWMLRSHFAVSFEDKIASFERVVAINPNNVLAATSLESLRSLLAPVEVKSPEVTIPAETANVEEGLSFEPVSEDPEPEMSMAFSGDAASPATVEDVTPEPLMDSNVEEVSSEFTALGEENSDEHETVLFNKDSFEEENNVEELVFAPLRSSAVEDEFFPTPTETVMPVSLEIPADEFKAEMSNGLAEASDDGSNPTESYTFPVIDLAETTSAQSDLSFDDDSIEETRPHFKSAVDRELAETAEPVDAYQPAYATSEPEAETYTPAPVIFEPVVAEEQEQPVEDQHDDSPLPFGNTLMFSLQADELKLKDETQRHAEPTYTNGASENHDFESGIPMPNAGASDENEAMSFSIPMPAEENFSVPEVKTGFETTVVPPTEFAAAPVAEPTVSAEVEKKACVFCTAENDKLAVSCQTCMAVLTLSDLEMLISNQNADRSVLREAIERLEAKRSEGELSEYEMTMLGIGYLNTRDLETGYERLNQASQMNPNNVILSSQVNALHIRAEEIKAKEVESGSMPKGKTILVVDDSPTIRKLISGKLEKSGHEVFCSADGVDAMEQLAVLHPDLVLLDITMPRMDGYQVCKLIRSNDATKDVPVVMISGKDGFFDKVRGRMAGSSGYITKPFGPETLMKVVEGYLNDGH